MYVCVVYGYVCGNMCTGGGVAFIVLKLFFYSSFQNMLIDLSFLRRDSASCQQGTELSLQQADLFFNEEEKGNERM